MIGRGPGRALLGGAALLAALLIAGRWLAVETAERAWAGTVTAGSVYLDVRSLSRLLRLAVTLVATLWGVGNLYIVYRAIGSVQMPRRVGNLEIVEAVPQRLLLLLAVATGIILGLGLAWGAGDWWREAALAAGAPHFGRSDPILGRDLGFYLGPLPWSIERQQFLLLATLTAAVLSAFLYVGIGSVRWQRGRLLASPHARAHLGVLLGGVALALLWGALLDPAEVVAGLHGSLDSGLVTVRLPGARAVAVAAGVAMMASLAWGAWDRPRLLAAGWGALVLAMLGVYWVFPVTLRRGGDESYSAERTGLTALAYGTARRTLTNPPGYATMSAFLATAPLWNGARVAAATRGRLGNHEVVSQATLARSAAGTPLWIVTRAPDDSALGTLRPAPGWDQVHRGSWTTVGGPLGFAETDSGLVSQPLAPADPVARFGEGFTQYAVIGGSDPAAGAGIELNGGWRRIALAWVLQSPEIARTTDRDERLLWRRTASERLARLAPFAEFDAPEPVYADGVLWWCATGYVSAETFPLVAPVAGPHGPVRYLRPGVVGAVRAGTGETRLWRAPGSDSLTAAWARLFAPLIAPADSLPPALARALRYPRQTFALAVKDILAAAPDSEAWRPLPNEPYELTLPADNAWWLAQGFTSKRGGQGHFEGVLLGRIGAAGPELWSVAPPASDAPPQLLVGSPDTVPGPLRMWIAAGHLATAQARFVQHGRDVPRLEHVFVAWGARIGEGATGTAALRDLAQAGPAGVADTSLAARWVEARRLFAALDSALAARDFERVDAVYRQLRDLFGSRRRALAPTPRPD